MAKNVKFNFPFAEIRGEYNGLIFRKNKSGTISCYPKPKRDYTTCPVSDKEKESKRLFARAAELAKVIESDPAEVEKYRLSYEVYCSIKPVSMHAYLMKVCRILAQREKYKQVTGKLDTEKGGEL